MNVTDGTKNVQKEKPQKSDTNGAKSKNNEITGNIKWTIADKEILLQALEKNGPKNIEGISKMLPNIPRREIKSKISEYSETAEQVYDDELIKKWMNCGLYEPGNSLIPQALLYIQLFEKHPSPSESEGYDLRAIYNFLYRSCFEETSYFDLTPKDRDLLCFLLFKTEEKFWPKCQAAVFEYIGRIYNRRNIKRVYPGKKKTSLLML